MKSFKNVPCTRDCADRCAGCHAVCQKYKDWRAEFEKEKADNKDAKKKSVMMDDIEVCRGDRINRMRRRKPKER